MHLLRIPRTCVHGKVALEPPYTEKVQTEWWFASSYGLAVGENNSDLSSVPFAVYVRLHDRVRGVAVE